MNVSAYIQSGNLEAYVLGALSAAEAREAADLVARYPELQAEVAAIEETIMRYARTGTAQPPAELMAKVWEALQQDAQQRPAGQVVDAPHALPRRIPLSAPTAGARRTSFRWAQAAVWIGLLGSLALNGVQTVRNTRLSRHYSQLQARVEGAQTSQQKTAAEYAALQAATMDPTAVRVVMKPAKAGGTGEGTVLYQPGAAKAYLALRDLPAPPSGKQYQLWIIREGKPVDIGMVPIGQQAGEMLQVPKEVRGAEAFAVSLEPAGGSTTPTADQILMLGAVES